MAITVAQDLPPPFDTIISANDAVVLSLSTETTPLPDGSMSWGDRSFATTGGIVDDAERPPEYESQSPPPTHELQYTFAPHRPDTMLILPPADAPSSHPLYCVTVAPNIFNPGASITSVHRGGQADGAFVGEFEWGPSNVALAVTIGGMQQDIDRVLRQSHIGGLFKHTSGNGSAFRWRWSSHRPVLHWKVEMHICTCYRVPDGHRVWAPHAGRDTPLAVFTGRPARARLDMHPHPHPTLTVYPDAHASTLLDHIVLSALLLELHRLAPSGHP